MAISPVRPARPAQPVQQSQASFVIGPPFAPEELRVLYERAGLQVQSGDDALSKRLQSIRQESVSAFCANPLPDGKTLLQKLMEGVLKKGIGKLEAAVSHANVEGRAMPCVTFALRNSTYVDGSPVGNLSNTTLKDIESGLGLAFKAEWIQSRVV